ncbi:MAG: outer membrane protein assembly factor BamA [Hydrogenophilaceae bacterium]|nr:outer membrane protein assembly factor BamA [Hydrogenophilaceae bacterium]
MNKRITALLIVAGLISPAFAIEPFVVRDIRVEGLQRTEAGTVFSYLPIKVGETLNDERAAAAIKALFATGFFKDVKLEAQGDVLIVAVEERPSISKLSFSGMKEFSEEDLKTGLKQTGLAEGRVFDKGLLDRAEQELKRQYFNRGLYSVQVVTTVTPLERNRVALQFDVVEGEAARIRQINLVGNKTFTEKALLKQFNSSTPNWLSWYTKDDQYSKTKLSGDLETLRSYYLNQGFLEFNIDSTQVSISPDKKDIYITVNMTEGPKYTVSDIRLAGQMLVPEQELRSLIMIKPGEVFSREKLTESSRKISDRLGNEGYAFANVNAVPELDKEKHQVAFTMFVDPGRRVYINRVNVSGNTKTRDEVIRREVRQMEGGWYNAEKINLSRERLNRLGFFNEVNVETPAVPGATDQVDVNISVAEKATGNILLGAGFSSSEGLVLSGSVNQSNVFGTGNRVAVQINSGSVNTVYSLSFTNPYYTLDGVSLGYDIYRRDVDATSLDGVGEYESSTMGLGLRVGLPISEKDTVFFGAGVEQLDLTTTASSPIQYKNFVAENGNSNNTLRLDSSIARDTRDNFLFPTKGIFQRAAIEFGAPPGDIKYYKLSLQHQQYLPLSKDLTLMLNGEIGYGGGIGSSDLPFYRNFFVGGVSSVRGFESGTIGPKELDPVTNEVVTLGGDTKLVGNIELLFPMPGMKDNSVRLSTFLDAGGVFGEGNPLYGSNTFSFDDMRFSAGLGVAWNSPLGPLRFSLAYPLNKKDTDKTQVFQFNLGSTF